MKRLRRSIIFGELLDPSHHNEMHESAFLTCWAEFAKGLKDRLASKPPALEHLRIDGDGFVLAFGKPADGIAIAFFAQALISEVSAGVRQNVKLRAPPDFELWLRIGVHVDYIDVGDAAFTGDGLAVAARLASMGTIGETIVSRQVQRELIPDVHCVFNALGLKAVHQLDALAGAVTAAPARHRSAPYRSHPMLLTPRSNAGSEQPGFTFLCHAREDKPAVKHLYGRLLADGHNPWLDSEDLLGGEDWKQAIYDAINKSRSVVVCLSQQSIQKTGYVQREIKIALDAAAERPDGSIFVIPVHLEPCHIPTRLEKWHSISLFSGDGYQRLLTALSRQ